MAALASSVVASMPIVLPLSNPARATCGPASRDRTCGSAFRRTCRTLPAPALRSIVDKKRMLQSFRQIAAVVIETKYNAQKGGWVLRLVRGLKGNQSRADILVLMPHAWTLHREEPNEHVADGKIAPMPKALDFPTDENVEEQAVARLAKAQAAQ